MVKNAEKFAKLVNTSLLYPTGKFFGLLHGSSSDSTSLDACLKFIISFWWVGRWYFNSAKQNCAYQIPVIQDSLQTCKCKAPQVCYIKMVCKLMDKVLVFLTFRAISRTIFFADTNDQKRIS